MVERYNYDKYAALSNELFNNVKRIVRTPREGNPGIIQTTRVYENREGKVFLYHFPEKDTLDSPWLSVVVISFSRPEGISEELYYVFEENGSVIKKGTIVKKGEEPRKFKLAVEYRELSAISNLLLEPNYAPNLKKIPRLPRD